MFQSHEIKRIDIFSGDPNTLLGFRQTAAIQMNILVLFPIIECATKIVFLFGLGKKYFYHFITFILMLRLMILF
jgi:hypothetical protein